MYPKVVQEHNSYVVRIDAEYDWPVQMDTESATRYITKCLNAVIARGQEVNTAQAARTIGASISTVANQSRSPL